MEDTVQFQAKGFECCFNYGLVNVRALKGKKNALDLHLGCRELVHVSAP